MTFTTKAIFTALALSLTPALAAAQSVPITNYGPGVGGAPAIGAPVQVDAGVRDCGASGLQGLVGQHVGSVRAGGLPARYFTPDSPIGTMDYQPRRLNVSTDANYIIDRVYCG